MFLFLLAPVFVLQVTGGMEGEVRVWNIGFQTQTMDASLKETGMVTLSKGEGTGFLHKKEACFGTPNTDSS